MDLEARKHRHSSVATLTYSRRNLPEGGSLVPEHPQKWIRALRKVLAPQKIRYFLVGEYGEDSLRPHYHVLLFGLNHHVAGGLDGRSGLVKKTWKYGHTLVDSCKPAAIAYVAGYVTKKLTKDERDSKSLLPEFTRMSLRPGIGAGSTQDISRAIHSSAGLEYINKTGDVPYALKNGSKIVPIGRYLRGLLREKLWGSRDVPLQRKKAYWQEMWALRKKAETDPQRKASTYKQYLVEKNSQVVLNLEARTKLLTGSHSF